MAYDKICEMIEEIENELALLAVDPDERNRLQRRYENLLELERKYAEV